MNVIHFWGSQRTKRNFSEREAERREGRVRVGVVSVSRTTKSSTNLWHKIVQSSHCSRHRSWIIIWTKQRKKNLFVCILDNFDDEAKKHLFVFDFCSKKREYKNWRTETIGENALLQLQLVSFLPSARLMRLHANVSSQFENSAQQFFHRLRSIRTHHSLSSGNLLFGRSKVKNGNRLGFAKLLLMT